MNREELKQMIRDCAGVTVGQFMGYARKIDGLTDQGLQEMSFLLKQSGKKGSDLGLQLLLWL